ncbi:MAG TPA: PAS domain S-box protein, partial [Polyangiaceae bacterium]|nr:PAS domain S-box protein [Polyangiaceae bacterium]
MQHQGELSATSLSELLDFTLEVGAMGTWEWHVPSGELLVRAAPALDFGRGPTRAEAWMEHVHPLDREMARQRAQACVSGAASSFEMLLRIRDREGGFRWLRSEGRVAARDEQGVPTRFIGVTQDVHRLRMIEETLRRNAELFGKIPDAIVCTELDGTVTYWNQGATELYGWTADEMVGKHISERFPPGARGKVAEIDVLLRAGSESSSEFLDYRKDGSRVWVEARIARYGSANAPTGIMGFARDVTKRRATQ